MSIVITGATGNVGTSVLRALADQPEVHLLTVHDGAGRLRGEQPGETFADEHATLLRIARRTAEDTGIGAVDEHILVSDGALVIARHLPSDRFVILVSSVPEQLGRLRFELKRAAWDLEKGV